MLGPGYRVSGAACPGLHPGALARHDRSLVLCLVPVRIPRWTRARPIIARMYLFRDTLREGTRSAVRVMTGKVFLNYRRADAEAWADRLFERLVRQFPRENVFMDINGHIPVGFPWADWLDSQVAACDLMLVLIGRSWVAEFETRSEPGERDYVRVEIKSALKRRMPVVPVLLGGALVPKPAELPDTIRPLLALQAVRLQRTSFDSDAEALLKSVPRSIALARGEVAVSDGTRPEGSAPRSTPAGAGSATCGTEGESRFRRLPRVYRTPARWPGRARRRCAACSLPHSKPRDLGSAARQLVGAGVGLHVGVGDVAPRAKPVTLQDCSIRTA